jgi:hypothetical protein
MLCMGNNLTINSGDNVSAGYLLSMPGSHQATTVSLAGGKGADRCPVSRWKFLYSPSSAPESVLLNRRQ